VLSHLRHKKGQVLEILFKLCITKNYITGVKFIRLTEEEGLVDDTTVLAVRRVRQ